MSNKTRVVGIVVVVIVGLLICGAVIGSGGFTRFPSQQEQTDGDCDAGDLRESKPDSDCNGLWLGTPTPAASKAKVPDRTPAGKPKTSPRR